ncbi:dihydroorotate dehydrogenase electron transfer subunit [Streptococcus macacae NCTC 11558]|uniref:Dihydroorotate dehydrogenase B (NAD(+)), electron transfer subunit n=1 Tax=Streptococcus macacae NCTC 11558 TaxID=764298 RepID=G5JUI3_9STRE|nr:dihydroorotate dehydrogenase, electron transfer subunit [Streptococcus macacae NCTC 11558]SUN78625.1 dihydroorotate dehydrogenase electron transfer subunit [Streptococcus macacae NCTC 11558]
MILKEDMMLVRQREIAPRIFEMTLSGDLVEEMAVGQFLHIRVPDATKLLRRPISISEIDREAKEATIIYRIEGEGTAAFSLLKEGSRLDCLGPQGNGFDTSFLLKGQTALLIGGGIGVPPLLALARELYEKGVEVIAVLGFANKEALILEDKLKQYAKVTVTTDDGSYGQKGYVSAVIDKMTIQADAVYACGAPGMLKYVDKHFANHPHAYISTESRMACGMGACYACVVHVKDQAAAQNLRVCKEGPVFKIGQIVLD